MVQAEDEVPRYKVVAPLNPAVGAELTVPMTGIGGWLVLSIIFDLVTSAVVANRLVDLIADDGTTAWFRAQAAAVQAASLTTHYTAFAGSSGQTAAGNTNTLNFMADGLWIPAGSKIRTSTQNLDPGDQYSNVGLSVIEFPSGPDKVWYPFTEYIIEEKG